ncbi:hypothetical protein [Janibacter cremeus]|uniref:Lipoprotein n=1 Tax=Janibacter cremeus TaxID=1285192 RepID=A0A852VU38_9MICO|nr:hypothetical protein [Janibacter cremeus]NYF98910.1 hypothetical protein [Janibacter cremeus]
MPGSRQRRSASIAALVLGGALTLGACGADEGQEKDSGSTATAAIVEGHEITVGQAQQSSREVGEVVAAQAESGGQPPQEVGPDQLIGSLIQVPTLIAFGQEHGIDVPSGATIEKQLGEAVHAPSETTVDFFRANAVYSQLDQKQQQEVAQQVRDLDVTISPRYRPDSQSPSWLKPPTTTPEMP